MSAPPLTPNASLLLCQRYFARGDEYSACPSCGAQHETLESFLDRVSLGNPDYRQGLIESLNFLPNSPTLFNVGITSADGHSAGTLSACFKFDVADSLLDGPDSIMATGEKAAAVTKFGGGVGYYLGNLRPKGAPISTTHGKAMGPVAVLRYFQSVGSMITQAGRRDAAQMGILDVDHPDIREFIHAKDRDPQSLNTFNISVAASDGFMHGATSGSAADNLLLWEIAESAWSTGDPGLYFPDAAERGNPTPWLGRLTGTNPCGEVPLLNNEPCNLGSINLGRFVRDGAIDWAGLGHTTRLATRYLDDIVTLNTFPVDEIREANLLTRKLGLGVCGWADMLALLHIPYESDEAVALGERLMGFINAEARAESVELAEERGPAPCFVGLSVRAHMFRNATRTCIAPTGSIAILMGASSGIEPHFALEWSRQLGTGEVIREHVPVIDRLNGYRPSTAHDIPWEWHLKHQAAFQKHTDLAVSKTVNLPNDATVQDVYNAYVTAWRMNVKGVTVFRDGCRQEQVLRTSSFKDEGTSSFKDEGTVEERCDNCGAEVKYEEGCKGCAAGCGWAACAA